MRTLLALHVFSPTYVVDYVARVHVHLPTWCATVKRPPVPGLDDDGRVYFEHLHLQETSPPAASTSGGALHHTCRCELREITVRTTSNHAPLRRRGVLVGNSY